MIEETLMRKNQNLGEQEFKGPKKKLKKLSLILEKKYKNKKKKKGLPCRDVRTREVGIRQIHQNVTPIRAELVRRDYSANGSWETFLAYEDPIQDILIGMLRLRKCGARTFR